MSWEQYYEMTKNRPLRKLYSTALSFLNSKHKSAMDLGCGAGIEVIDLLNREFVVHGVDFQPLSIQSIQNQLNQRKSQFYGHVTTLELWKEWPQVDFIFSYHALPFCKASYFNSVIQKMIDSVNPGGILAISLFGQEHDWVLEKQTVGVSEEFIRTQLKDFEIISFQEKKERAMSTFEGEIFWHYYEVIAQKR